MSNYLSIASEDDFEAGPPSGSILYPIIFGVAIVSLIELYLSHRSIHEDPEIIKKDRRKQRESTKLRELFYICVLAFLFTHCLFAICTNLCWQVNSFTNQARIQNATMVVRSLESYRDESQEKRDQIEKKLNETAKLSKIDPFIELELEAELRVEDRNLAYVEDQLKQAKLKKDSLEFFLSSNQDRTLLREYRKLRIDNAKMSKVLNEMKSNIQALRDELAGLKKGSEQSKVYQIERRELATTTK